MSKKKRKNRRIGHIQTLEKREVFSVTPLSIAETTTPEEQPLAPAVVGDQASVSLGEDHVLRVEGTDRSDRIEVRQVGRSRLAVRVDGREIWRSSRGAEVEQVVVNGHGGDDWIRNNTRIDSRLVGGEGDDRLTGGSGHDTLVGGAGNDRLQGRHGDDTLLGGPGRDRLSGGRGRDVLGRGGDDRNAGVQSEFPAPTLPVIQPEVPAEPRFEVVQQPAQDDQSDSQAFVSATLRRPNFYRNPTTRELIELRGDGPYSVAASGTLRINVSTLTANDRFENIDASELDLVEGGFKSRLGGTVEVRNGVFTYRPPSKPSDTQDAFSYKFDYKGERVTAWVQVRITDAAPVANDDFFRYSPGRTTTLSVINGLLRNDSDPGNSRKAGLRVSSARLLTAGAGSIRLSQFHLSFKPATGYSGQVEIEYTITDAEGLTDRGLVTLRPSSTKAPTPPAADTPDQPPTSEAPVPAVLPEWLTFQKVASPAVSYELHIDASHPDADRVSVTRETYNVRREAYDPIQGTFTKNAGLYNAATRSHTYHLVSSASGERVLIGVPSYSRIVFNGSDGDDWFANNTSIPSTIYAGAGDDEIHGGAGRDIVDGGQGNDKIFGHGGNDVLRGGHGDDRLEGGSGDDSVEGGEGSNSLLGGEGDDHLIGGSGADQMWGGVGDDAFVGNAGDDLLYGEDGKDRLLGGAGDDKIFGGAGADFISGDEGNDELHGEKGHDRIQGDAGSDLIFGGLGADHLLGGSGDDRLEGGRGNDSLYGEEGADTLLGQSGRDKIWGGVGNDTLYGNAGDDLLYGQDGDDSLHGGKGSDRLNGQAGSDVLRGGEGADYLIARDLAIDALYGGAGEDRFDARKKRWIKSH